MGLGVLAATLWRVFVVHVPQAELMGAFGIVALVVNVVCAVILLKHREGDANVQAVWLFSRNDALGNAAIVVAAVLVAATGTPWPDLVVAAAIAGLFLQSAWRIIAVGPPGVGGGRVSVAGPREGNVGTRPLVRRLKSWAGAIKVDVVALWLAARDRRTPWHAKAVAAAVAAYALSPIDLIPDFIPVLGYLDDLVIVPLGILLAIRLIPADLMEEFRREAASRARPVSAGGAVAVVVIWIVVAAVLLVWLLVASCGRAQVVEARQRRKRRRSPSA